MDRSEGWKNRLMLHRIFFFSTLKVSIPIAVMLSTLGMVGAQEVMSGKVFIAYVSRILFFIPTFGLAFDLLYKHLTRKEKYLFWHNKGISKIELWTGSFLASTLLCIIIHQLIHL